MEFFQQIRMDKAVKMASKGISGIKFFLPLQMNDWRITQSANSGKHLALFLIRTASGFYLESSRFHENFMNRQLPWGVAKS